MEIEADTRSSSHILQKQGAEARVFESDFVGRRYVVKERFSKKYRHPILDSKLTLKRLNAEARCMTKARRLGVCTPVLYAVDPVSHTLTFEFVLGPSVKDVFLEFGLHGVNEKHLDDIASQIGDAIGKIHDGGLIHGDLTTFNMLRKNGTDQLVLVDFGLSFTSTLPEDKAVDLYVLERAPSFNALFMWKCDGPDTRSISQIVKAMVIQIQQAGPSATERTKEDHGRMILYRFPFSSEVKIAMKLTNEYYRDSLYGPF